MATIEDPSLAECFMKAMSPPPAPPSTCSSCRYWVPNDEPQGITSDHGWGECRCHPPQVVVVHRMAQPDQETTVFPFTTGELWCGDHERVEPGAA